MIFAVGNVHRMRLHEEHRAGNTDYITQICPVYKLTTRDRFVQVVR